MLIEEIALRVSGLEQKIDAQQKEIDRLRGSEFTSLAAFAKDVGLSPPTIRRQIKKAIDNPADSPLVNGRHFIWVNPGISGTAVKVNPRLLREALGLSSQ
jgi:hypothetical protein